MMMPQDSDDNTGTNPDEWADCPLTAQTVRFDMRGKRYYSVQVSTEHHRVQVAVSPQGRSVRVYLDGALMTEEPPELDARLRRSTGDA